MSSRQQANPARATLLLELGVRRGDRVVWCGQNSPVDRAGDARGERKIGAVTTVPLNYRLSPEEASLRRRQLRCRVSPTMQTRSTPSSVRGDPRSALPKLREILDVRRRARSRAMIDADARIAAAARAESRTWPTVKNAAGTMIYTSGTTGKPKGAVRQWSGQPRAAARKLLELIGYVPDDVYLTTGPLYHSGPGGFMSDRALDGPQRRDRPAQVRPRGLAAPRREVPGDDSTFSAPTPIRMICNLLDDDQVHARFDTRRACAVMIANAAPWSFALKKAYLERLPRTTRSSRCMAPPNWA